MILWLLMLVSVPGIERIHVHAIDYNHVYDETDLEFKHDQVLFWNKDRTVRGYVIVKGSNDVPDGTKFYIARRIDRAEPPVHGPWVIVTSDFYCETWTCGDPEVARRVGQ